MKCNNCGSENSKNDKFCNKCGNSLKKNKLDIKLIILVVSVFLSILIVGLLVINLVSNKEEKIIISSKGTTDNDKILEEKTKKNNNDSDLKTLIEENKKNNLNTIIIEKDKENENHYKINNIESMKKFASNLSDYYIYNHNSLSSYGEIDSFDNKSLVLLTIWILVLKDQISLNETGNICYSKEYISDKIYELFNKSNVIISKSNNSDEWILSNYYCIPREAFFSNTSPNFEKIESFYEESDFYVYKKEYKYEDSITTINIKFKNYGDLYKVVSISRT